MERTSGDKRWNFRVIIDSIMSKSCGSEADRRADTMRWSLKQMLTTTPRPAVGVTAAQPGKHIPEKGSTLFQRERAKDKPEYQVWLLKRRLMYNPVPGPGSDEAPRFPGSMRFCWFSYPIATRNP